MKNTLLLITLVIILGCSSSSNFEKYLNSLTLLKAPLTLTDTSNVNLSPKYDQDHFNEFKISYSQEPIGKLVVNGSFITTLEYAVTDNGYAPILVTYDLQGNKKDSLYLLQHTGYGDYGQTIERAEIDKNLQVTIFEISKTWQVDSEYNPIDSTIITEFKKRQYRVSENGRIEKNGG
jgi:hypothetical protein